MATVQGHYKIVQEIIIEKNPASYSVSVLGNNSST